MADPDVRRRSDGSWDATDPLLDHVKASVTLEMADDLLVQVLPEPERSNPPLTVLLTALSLESRRREAWSSSWAEATTGPVELMLRRAEWAGAVDIQAVLVRSTDVTSAVDGYAVSAAARLAWSQVDRIIFDEPGQLPPGGRLKIDWVRFSEGNDWLQRCQRQLFALEYADPPRLLLNEDVPAAKLILSSSGTRGRRPRIRDATFMQIVHQAWSSLLISSLTKLATVVREDPENQQDTDTMLAEIEGWRSGVLQDWARWLFPESGDQDTALASLFEHVRTLSMEEIVVRRLPYAISERLETWRGFVGLSREFGVAARPEEVRGVQ